MTLHDLRWAYAAARAAMFLMLLVLISMTEPSVGHYVFAPSLSSGHRYAVRNDDVVVTVRPDGTTFVASQWVEAESLVRELAWLGEHNPRSRLVLRADRGARFGAVRQVIRAAGEAGWRRITIEGQPPMLLLERRVRAGLALPQHDDSELVQRESGHGTFSLEGMWR